MRGLAIVAMMLAAPASAQPAPAGGFTIAIDHRVPAPPQSVYDRLVKVGSWWTPAHTYSGNAANLSLDARAGGCWCETWPGGSVEHGRVLAAMPGRLLRIGGGLGPLQERPVAAVLTFTLTPVDEGRATSLAVRYRVAGPVADLEAPVTGVVRAQVDRLVAAFR